MIERNNKNNHKSLKQKSTINNRYSYETLQSLS